MDLLERFEQWHPVLQALTAGLFTWGLTAAGASLVFFTRSVHRRLLDSMLGFSGGVMLAASNWSLLVPAIEISEQGSLPSWVPPAIGFLCGGAALWAMDKSLPHLHLGGLLEEAEGPKTTWSRAILLVSAITLHNIPEGLAVGVAFGGVIGGESGAGVTAALVLALGIGIQNFPEGVAVAMPLRGEGVSRRRCFWYGQLSAVVEPVAAVVGAAAVFAMAPLLPYALSFAAGAMVYVVVEELIPESHREGNVDLATVSLMLGFAVMMVLDVALG
ncbi:ZIP family metal transporter [Roseimaritima sediminicola]|uniref:ZIP family metal transporter n=1 Tax=Roseimaritima sediminicola TaxID=2662066 RepID=UPI0012983ADD|nr:ZIP family metal transporter [Roseimaritima sediminicola]